MIKGKTEYCALITEPYIVFLKFVVGVKCCYSLYSERKTYQGIIKNVKNIGKYLKNRNGGESTNGLTSLVN